MAFADAANGVEPAYERLTLARRGAARLRGPCALVDEFNRAFKTVRGLPCDVQLGDHGAQYNMQEKYAKLKDGGANPFIDPASCTLEADVEEAMFHAILAEQQQATRP